MQSAADIMIAAYRNVGPRIRAGMTPADIAAMINSRGHCARRQARNSRLS